MKTLHIFDFDDTLINSDAKVKITDKDGNVKELSSEEYASYSHKETDEQDFTAFDAYPKNPEIIGPVFLELKAAIAKSGSSNVVILTARSNPVPVRLFLNENKIPNIDIVAVGSSNPLDKALYILKRVKDDAFEEVQVFEDNVRNIRSIRKVMKGSNIVLKTNRVKNGKIES